MTKEIQEVGDIKKQYIKFSTEGVSVDYLISGGSGGTDVYLEESLFRRLILDTLLIALDLLGIGKNGMKVKAEFYSLCLRVNHPVGRIIRVLAIIEKPLLGSDKSNSNIFFFVYTDEENRYRTGNFYFFRLDELIELF